MPADHPLAKRRAVPIAELAGLDPVDSLVGCDNRTVVDRAFGAASGARCVAIEITGQSVSGRQAGCAAVDCGRTGWPSGRALCRRLRGPDKGAGRGGGRSGRWRGRGRLHGCRRVAPIGCVSGGSRAARRLGRPRGEVPAVAGPFPRGLPPNRT
ncbi:hypothetical protein B1C81_36620 [Streptomyces sp. HG99]|nr:hypothetical protein B1C81_36620 [Streptomyces sp. HG99]